MWRNLKFRYIFQISPHLPCIEIWNFSTLQIFLHMSHMWTMWQIWGMGLHCSTGKRNDDGSIVLHSTYIQDSQRIALFCMISKLICIDAMFCTNNRGHKTQLRRWHCLRKAAQFWFQTKKHQHVHLCFSGNPLPDWTTWELPSGLGRYLQSGNFIFWKLLLEI